MTTEFTELGLHPLLVQTVTDRGYTEPTPIQIEMIPLMLSGRDVIGQAQTGTGKTAAFALPMLQNLTVGLGYVQCLVLAPTRELAMQVAHAMEQYGDSLGVSVLAVYGGQAYGRQIGRLRKGVDIVVGTPGRLIDLIDKKVLDLSKVNTVVLDEADEMLSMGFIEDIETILSHTPDSRQTALFSATLPFAIRKLADQYMHEPESITIKRKQMTVASTDQRYYLVNEADKLAALTRLFEVEDITSALIFVRTRARTGELANALSARGFAAEALSGEMSQDARTRVLKRFRDSRLNVLVATDVAARGLDVDDISHVFNVDLPPEPEVYVHRIGRTGRAGKTGIAITLLTPMEMWRLNRIEGYTKQKITPTILPTVEEIQARRDMRLQEQVLVWLQRGRCNREREMVAALMVEGHDPVEIAAVALKLARVDEKQRPITPISEARHGRPRKSTPYKGKRDDRRGGNKQGRKPSKEFHDKNMVRLSLSLGQDQGIRANDVVRTIARYADIPGYTIGKIRIQQNRTLVDVPEQYVGKVLSKNGAYRIGKQSVAVERA